MTQYKFGKYKVSFWKSDEKDEYYLEIDDTEEIKTGKCMFWLTGNKQSMIHLFKAFQGINKIGLHIKHADLDLNAIASLLSTKL